MIEGEDDAAAELGNLLHRKAELIAAVALEAAEEVAGQASGVQPHRYRGVRIGFADDDRQLIPFAVAAVENDELAVHRFGQRHRGARGNRQCGSRAVSVAGDVDRCQADER